MAIIRVQAIMDHDNGLPKDAVVNTFHFTGNEADAGTLATDVVEFYTTATTGGRHLSDWMSPTHNGVYAKAYVVNDEIVDGKLLSNSGPPIATTLKANFRVPQIQSQESLPSEVAVVLSTRNLSNPNVPKARRTGRVYFGPLNIAARAAAAGGVARPDPGLLLDLREMGNRLHDQAALHGGVWVIYSRPFAGREAIPRPGRTTLPALPARPAGNVYEVEQVWTDDAFDTQRRRGIAASAKQLLTVN